MKVINLFGGPGSGKSTIAAGLFYEMKLLHKNVELVTEYAKDLVYSETFHALKKNQQFIFAEQNRRQKILKDKVDWAITDSPLLLSHVYGDLDDVTTEAFFALVSETFQSYDNVSFYIKRPEQFSEIGRAHNLSQSEEIDVAIFKVLQEEYEPFFYIKADNNAVGKILSHLVL